MSETDAPTDADAIAAAAVRLAGERGWRSLPLGDIATEAGVPLSTLARHYICRPEILDGFERMIDRRMLAGAAAGDIGDKPRDRLFDIIMERFDALLPYRDGVRRIARELPFDPASGLVLAAALPRTVGWMFTGARIAVAGPGMPIKLAALSGAYVATLRVWLSDDSQDLGKTMAALDKRLGQAMTFLGGGFGRTRPSEPSPEAAPPDIAEPEPKPAPKRIRAAKTAKRKAPSPDDGDVG
jgi:AcrR family transcriptional regulator